MITISKLTESPNSFVVTFNVDGTDIDYRIPAIRVTPVPPPAEPPTVQDDFLVNVTFNCQTTAEGLTAFAKWQTYEHRDFVYEYRQSGTTAWTGILRPGEMYTVPLNNLQHDTQYEFRIKLVDNSMERNVIRVSKTYTFTTPKQ